MTLVPCPVSTSNISHKQRMRSCVSHHSTHHRACIIRCLLGGAEQWDKAVVDANGEYRTRMHNIFCDNCHSHVAYALNSMNMRAFGFNSWDMIKLCFLVFFRGRFLSWGGFLAQFLPFGAFVLVVVLLKTL